MAAGVVRVYEFSGSLAAIASDFNTQFGTARWRLYGLRAAKLSGGTWRLTVLTEAVAGSTIFGDLPQMTILRGPTAYAAFFSGSSYRVLHTTYAGESLIVVYNNASSAINDYHPAAGCVVVAETNENIAGGGTGEVDYLDSAGSTVGQADVRAVPAWATTTKGIAVPSVADNEVIGAPLS
jgi:hypothetical protein